MFNTPWVVWSDDDKSIWICPIKLIGDKKVIEELENFTEAVNAWTFYKNLFGNINI
jgi:hypothetical protein